MSCFEGTLLRVLKIEETGGGKHPKRQTRDVPAIYLCRRGPPARNLRHFLFFSPLSSFSSTFLSLFLSPAPFILSLSAPLRIFFFLFVLVFLPHLSSPFFSLSLPSHAVSFSLSVSVRPLLRIYESTRLYKWTHCSFLGQHVARGSLLSFKKGVVFRCRVSHSATRAPRKRDNRKWYIDTVKRMLRYIRGIEIRNIIGI